MTDPLLTQDLQLLFRLLVALVLAGILGWERESKGKAAGLRTHMLVGVSAAMFVLLGEVMMSRYAGDTAGVQVDSTRVLSAVATGISFLGAGTIFVSRDHTVQGLTTAASLLATAAVGIAVGMEHYVLAVGTTLLLFIVLRGLGSLELSPAEPREALKINRASKSPDGE